MLLSRVGFNPGITMGRAFAHRGLPNFPVKFHGGFPSPGPFRIPVNARAFGGLKSCVSGRPYLCTHPRIEDTPATPQRLQFFARIDPWPRFKASRARSVLINCAKTILWIQRGLHAKPSPVLSCICFRCWRRPRGTFQEVLRLPERDCPPFQIGFI